jgi:hypothetical protein
MNVPPLANRKTGEPGKRGEPANRLAAIVHILLPILRNAAPMLGSPVIPVSRVRRVPRFLGGAER